MDSETHDPLDAGVYAHRLSKVGETKNVVATSDIRNSQGAIIIKSGSPMNAMNAARIAKFKLQQPLESLVEVEDEINGNTLFKHIMVLLKKDPTLFSIHQQLQADRELLWLCNFYTTFPQVKQMVTVLSMQMQKVYRQSLLSAWIALVIAKNLGLSQKDIESVFLAAISHDIGMLHIDEHILSKGSQLTAEEWRRIYAHPVIAASILGKVSGVANSTITAVQEHHEKCDGTGYPKGRFDQELSQQGQILAFADTVAALLVRLMGRGQSFWEMIPVMQINMPAYAKDVYRAFMSSVVGISRTTNPSTLTDETIGPYIDTMKVKASCLHSKLAIFERITSQMGLKHDDRKLHSLQTLYLHISIAVHGAGLLDAGYVDCLEAVRAQKDRSAYREIEDTDIMLNELDFQVKRMQRILDEWIEADPSLIQRFKQEVTALNDADGALQRSA